jgi:hypothetical protein
MKSANAVTVRDLVWGRDLPNQLVILRGQIVLRSTGMPAIFDMPDGLEVNVLPHDDMVVVLDNAAMWKYGHSA